MKLAVATAVAIFLLASIAIALVNPFKNLDDIARGVGIATYAQSQSQRTIKIAILDNGFLGREKAIGKTLPADTQYHAGPIAVDAKTEEAHGLYMAEILAALLNRTPNISYELHLFSAFGYSNLQSAVQQVVADHYDVVLYSQVWEYGGNGDGKGFINTVVNQATAAGVIWINAAGNFADATYRAPIISMKNDWAMLPSPNNGVRVQCHDNPKHKCSLRAVLSWNDFKDQADLGTDKDLDLVLSDDTLKVLRTGGLQQAVTIPAGPAGDGLSLYPREIVEAEVTPGLYELRAKVRSQNFTKQDELRITTSGDYIEQLDTSNSAETLLAPADNPSVITVGASDSAKSSSSASQAKPEVSASSLVVLEGGDRFKGTSNSAAMTAALAVIARGLNPNADRNSVIEFIRGRNTSNSGQPPRNAPTNSPSAPRNASSLQPTGPGGCFKLAILPSIPDALQTLLRQGAFSIETGTGFKIITADNPWTMGLGPKQKLATDKLVVSNAGFQAVSQLPANAYELLQRPSNMRICQ